MKYLLAVFLIVIFCFGDGVQAQTYRIPYIQPLGGEDSTNTYVGEIITKSHEWCNGAIIETITTKHYTRFLMWDVRIRFNENRSGPGYSCDPLGHDFNVDWIEILCIDSITDKVIIYKNDDYKKVIDSDSPGIFEATLKEVCDTAGWIMKGTKERILLLQPEKVDENKEK